jgi:protein gp37
MLPPTDPMRFGTWPWHHVWLGTTAENQTEYDRRWPYLASVNASIRFLSCEPLLGPITLEKTGPDADWVITGGESGHHARPYDVDWAHALIHEAPVDTAVFVKQLGAKPHAGGRPMTHPLQRLDPAWTDPAHWPASLQVRQFPEAP